MALATHTDHSTSHTFTRLLPGVMATLAVTAAAMTASAERIRTASDGGPGGARHSAVAGLVTAVAAAVFIDWLWAVAVLVVSPQASWKDFAGAAGRKVVPIRAEAQREQSRP